MTLKSLTKRCEVSVILLFFFFLNFTFRKFPSPGLAVVGRSFLNKPMVKKNVSGNIADVLNVFFSANFEQKFCVKMSNCSPNLFNRRQPPCC